MKRKTWSRKYETNILRVYESARSSEIADGMLWYQRGHDLALSMADRYGLDVEQTCGVMAAVSPGRQWGQNLLDAESLCSAFTAGRRLPLVGSYGWKNVNKARAILHGRDALEVFPKTGPKVRAFYACLLSPMTSREVCIDRHAKCLALGLWRDREAISAVRLAEFDALAWHYEHLANRLGLIPHQLQAICWVTWRRMLEEYDRSSMSFDFEELEKEFVKP